MERHKVEILGGRSWAVETQGLLKISRSVSIAMHSERGEYEMQTYVVVF